MYLLEKNFDTATKEELEELRSFFEGKNYKSSGHTFTSMYMWGPSYETSWQIIDGFLWTASAYVDEDGQKQYYSTMPLSKDDYADLKALASSMKTMKERFEAEGKSFVLYQVPKHLVEKLEAAWEGPLEIEEDRDSFDYVYKRESLVKLGGRALHKKKNHLNYFLKNYEYEFEDLKDEDLEEAMAFVRECNEAKEYDSPMYQKALENETKAIERVLRGKKEGAPLYLVKVIKICQRIEALAIGGIINNGEALEHIEKANPRIRGLYQVINQCFAKSLPEEIKFINREEDMGIENLRQAKEGYKPALMYEKSTVIVL